MSPLIQEFPFAAKRRNQQVNSSIESFAARPKPKKTMPNPHSILTGNSAEEWNAQKSHLESMMGGSKTTRANMLAQMHVKKQFQTQLEAGRIQKMLNR